MAREHVEDIQDIVQADVQVSREGGLFLFYLLSQDARAWVEENVGDGEELQWWGDALVVEHRYALRLAQGMQAEGLEVR